MSTLATNQAQVMDALYGSQTRIYDLTRRYYLLGRDPALARIDVRPGDRVCEVGTGTARNLIKLARRAPHAEYHGVDVSARMLDQAARCVARAGLADRIALHHGAAEGLDDLGLPAWDAILFSYCLSLLSDQGIEAALAAAWRNLAPGGRLYCVDFGPLPEWPAPVRGLFSLVRRLGLLHGPFEGYRQTIVDHLQALTTGDHVSMEPLCGGYALLITVEKPVDEIESALGHALIAQQFAARPCDAPFMPRGDL